MWVKSNLLCAKSNLYCANLFFNLLIYKDLRAVFFTQRVSKRLQDIYSPYASAPGECSIKINKQLGSVVLCHQQNLRTQIYLTHCEND